MSELFTIKLDLSAVSKDESQHQFYILLINTKKTRMIYEFKLWVRFLFSLESLIELVYDNAIVHDLEDIQILSLLKTVKIVPVEYVAEEQVRQKNLLSKLKKYNEMCRNITHDVSEGNSSLVNLIESASEANNSGIPNSNQKQDACKRSSREINTESESLNLTPSHQYLKSKIISEGDKQNHFCAEGDIPERKNEVYTKSCETVEIVNESVSSNFSPHSFGSFSHSESKRSGSLRNGDNIESAINNVPHAENQISCGNDKIRKNKLTPYKKQYEKPFSLSHILSVLRNEASVSGNGNIAEVKETKIGAYDHPFCGTSQESSDQCGNEIAEVAEKKTRKRQRKHKSKRNDFHVDKQLFESVNSFQSFASGVIINQSSENIKPKHIRFDGYDMEFEERESSYVNSNKIMDNNVSESLNDCKGEVTLIDEIKHLIDDKRKSLRSVSNEVDIMNDNNNPNSQGPDGLSKTEIYTEDGNANGNGNGNGNGNDIKTEENANGNKAETDNYCSVLDALGNLRKQNQQPLIFKRFF